MRWLFLCLFAVFAGPVHANEVPVRAGEHGTFTRLVLRFPAPPDWTLGRALGGYALSAGRAQPAYDFARTFDLITRDRIRNLRVDPDTGYLRLDLACACHAIPFEFDRRTLVIDIFDGPAPPGSVFEAMLQSGPTSAEPPRLQAAPRTAANRPAYDWTALPPKPPVAVADLSFPAAETTAEASLAVEAENAAFRQRLIEEIGRGASQALVEVEVPTNPLVRAPQNDLDQARVALGELPGVAVSSDPDQAPSLTMTGGDCPTDATFAPRTWVAEGATADTLVTARNGLLAEFDEPRAEQLEVAVLAHLYFGFGAEARGLLNGFSSRLERSDELATLSYIVDLDPAPKDAFSGMQSCDGSAALWALLAAPDVADLRGVNGRAVARSFMALPPHLKQTLAPAISGRLAETGDVSNAGIVANAMARAAPEGDDSVALLTAEIALRHGEPIAAEAALQDIDSPAIVRDALITKVASRFQQRGAVALEDVQALEAFAFENGHQSAPLHRALVQASALSGDFAAAFRHAGDDPDLRRDVWAVLADTGGDTGVLEFSVGADPAEIARQPDTVRAALAQRLLNLGLPNAALPWSRGADDDPALAAAISLANRDGRSALKALATDRAADPQTLADAYAAVGDYAMAAETLDAAGLTEAAARLRLWAGDTPAPAEASDDPWGALAAALADQTPPDSPPLAQGQALLDTSSATRERIAALLAATGIPAGGPEQPDPPATP